MGLLQGEVEISAKKPRSFLLAKWKCPLKKNWSKEGMIESVWKPQSSMHCLHWVWFRLTEGPLHFYYPFWTHKMLLLLFKKKKSWMTLAFTGVSHWLEPSVAWPRGSKQIPVLHSTLWSSPEQSPCQPWFASRDLQFEQNCSLLCVHTGAWWVRDNTTHSWKTFLLVTYKAFSLVTSAIMNPSHSKHVGVQEWNPIPDRWLLPDEPVNMGLSLELDFLELDYCT